MFAIIAKPPFLIFAFFALGGCFFDAPRNFSGQTMGTTYTVSYHGRAVDKNLVAERLDEIERIFSNWDSASELSKFNRAPSGEWLAVSDELYAVLRLAQKIHEETNGYFDGALGRVVDAWGFGAKTVDNPPNSETLVELLASSSQRYLHLKNGRAMKDQNLHLNLSAIVKGYALDEVAKLLKRRGIDDFLIELGGEVLAAGTNNGKAWRVGVHHPGGGVPFEISLQNRAVATSGDYRNRTLFDGVFYAHIIDPKTGRPATTDLSSVSVVHHQAAAADAYATAMFAMGFVRARNFAEKHNLGALLISDRKNNFRAVRIHLDEN